MKEIINEIKSLNFTRRAFLDFAQFDELKQDIEVVAEEVVKFCEDNEIVNLVNRIYVDDYGAVVQLAKELKLDRHNDTENSIANKVYDELVENQLLYESSNGVIFDFRIENTTNDDFMDLNDAMAFLRWQMELKIDEDDTEVEEMLDGLFIKESWREVQFQGEHTMFWFDCIKDEDGRIKFNMEIENE